MIRRAVLTGANGQDAYWLTKMLLELDYEVHGFARRPQLGFLEHLPKKLQDKINLHVVDVTDTFAVDAAIARIKPQELYHLAAFSSVRNSWLNPEMTYQINTMGTLNILNSVRTHCGQDCKMFFAASSECFGNPAHSPQTEHTPLNPISPYGISKTAAMHTCRSYREAYKMPIVCGISYNHDSAIRNPEFVMRKIANMAVKISLGLEKHLDLGDLEAARDFGYAPDFVRGYWQALQADPSDYVFATGATHTIREICEHAFKVVNLPITWERRSGIYTEVGLCKGKSVIHTNFSNFRPLENHQKLVGDATKAKQKLGWYTTKNFNEIIEEMIAFDLIQLRK